MVPSSRLQTCTLVLTFLSIYVPVALAQVIEEVVVTAQKREQREQDVGISMTTFSPEQIRHRRPSQVLHYDNSGFGRKLLDCKTREGLRCRSRLCDLFFAAVVVHCAVGGGFGADR